MTTGFCNKCGFSGQAGEFGQHLRPSDGRACSYMAGSPPAKPHPAPIPSEVGPEVVTGDLEALCREMLAMDNSGPAWVLPRNFQCRLRALLPEPVDADRFEAKRLANIWEIPEEAAFQILVRGRALAAGDR